MISTAKTTFQWMLLSVWAFSAGSVESAATERGRNQIVVSPNGPDDGGDYGPQTPGTKTAGLQEALDAAKAQARDVYLAGGSWTADKTKPVVYHLHTTLHVPWMQNFRLDSGHCVLNYTPKTGDAMVMDSQMSCSYRFGIIVSASDGATVRMKPTTAGPDRFSVITSTEFVCNAIVGGGGAWPSGEPYNSRLDTQRKWKGVGLWLDGSQGSIDANKITIMETVGCEVGLLVTGATTRNTIENVNIHLCQDHVRLGTADDVRPGDNRIEAFMDCQGIDSGSGAVVYSSRNLLTLSGRHFPHGPLLVFAPTASENVAFVHSRGKIVDESTDQSNRVLSAGRTPSDTPSASPE